MASQLLRDCRLWLDGYDLSGDMNALAITYSAAMLDDTRFGDSTKRNAGGVRSIVANHQGLWNGGDTGVDAVLFSQIGAANAPMTLSPTTGAEGEVAFTFRSLASQYQPGAKHGDLLMFSVSAEGGDGAPLVRGTVLHNATKTATGTGSIYQMGATASGQKLYGALHVTAAAGTSPTLAVKVQSAALAGFGTPTDRLTFATKSAIGSDWQTAAGPITDAYHRVSFTIGGTGASFSFVVILGIA